MDSKKKFWTMMVLWIFVAIPISVLLGGIALKEASMATSIMMWLIFALKWSGITLLWAVVGTYACLKVYFGKGFGIRTIIDWIHNK